MSSKNLGKDSSRSFSSFQIHELLSQAIWWYRFLKRTSSLLVGFLPTLRSDGRASRKKLPVLSLSVSKQFN
ncbi:hypothetical protein TNCV_4706601 [Trichonephila clavipes]|nr:hypothetical protein TNCV_4706601 [Trichonephila clavipes]